MNGQLQERALLVPLRQEAQRALGEALAFEAVGPEGKVRAVHLHGRAGDEHHRLLAIDGVELLLGERLPADPLGCLGHGNLRYGFESSGRVTEASSASGRQIGASALRRWMGRSSAREDRLGVWPGGWHPRQTSGRLRRVEAFSQSHRIDCPKRWIRSMQILRVALPLLAAILLTSPALAAPGKSALRSPIGKCGKKPAFEFAHVPGSTWHYLWIENRNGPIFKKWFTTADSRCSGGKCSIDPGLDLPSGVHYWWIQTYDSSGNGPWSDRGEFEVDPNHGRDDSGHDLPPGAPFETVHWIDHLGFRAGSDAVEVSFDAFDSGIGRGTSGLVVTAGPGDSPQVVEQGLAVPPGLLVKGVRICFETTSDAAKLAAVRIEQLDDPPDATRVLLVDDTGFAASGAECLDSADARKPIDPSVGGLRLQLGFMLPSQPGGEPATEGVVIRSVGLHVISDPRGPVQQELARLRKALEKHTHKYLTGRGEGHNNTRPSPASPSSTTTTTTTHMTERRRLASALRSRAARPSASAKLSGADAGVRPAPCPRSRCRGWLRGRPRGGRRPAP